MFLKKYVDEKQMFEKNCIEFLVELGEFVNETKCFKYWSIKKPNYDEMLEELADVFGMLLYFYDILDIEVSYSDIGNNDKSLLELINETYYFGTKLYKELNKNLLEKIFGNLLSIANLLKITEKEIITVLIKKQNIVEERLNMDY